MSDGDGVIGVAPPQCPQVWADGPVPFPSVVFVFTLTAVCAVIFSLIIAFKYNYVKVFNRKIRADIISNTLWIVYYSLVTIRSITVALRFALGPSVETDYDAYILAVTLTTQACVVLMLTFALNYQRRFRSAKIVPEDGTDDLQSQDSYGTTLPPGVSSGLTLKNKKDFMVKLKEAIKRYVHVLEVIVIVLFFCSLISMALALILLIIVTTIIIVVSIMIVIMIRNGQKLTYKRNSFDDSATFYIFLNFYVLQHLPIVCLVLYIILFAKHREGPTILSKVWLFLAMALNITNDLPLNLWAEVLPSTCSLYICSWVDVIHLLYLLSLLFFFLFVRSEFLRNIEECIWTTMGEIQETFDIRKF